MFCSARKRRLPGAAFVSAPDGYVGSYTFGTAFEHTAEGAKVVRDARAEIEANSTKRHAVDMAKVSEYVIGSGDAVVTDHVWIQCKASYEEDEPHRRACYAEQGDRTPQVGDEIAVTGFGGKCWWAGKIFAIHPGKGRRRGRELTFVAEVYYAESVTKTTQTLSSKTYGPARCKVGDVRVDRRTVRDSYTPGWVFLVPLETTATATDVANTVAAGAAEAPAVAPAHAATAPSAQATRSRE